MQSVLDITREARDLYERSKENGVHAPALLGIVERLEEISAEIVASREPPPLPAHEDPVVGAAHEESALS